MDTISVRTRGEVCASRPRWIEPMDCFEIVLGYRKKLGTGTKFRLPRGPAG